MGNDAFWSHLDYSTTQGSGHNNQIIFLRSPNEVGNDYDGIVSGFCTDIPVTDSFGTTNDFSKLSADRRA